MSLAQVAYNLSTDADFAAKWDKNPQAALAGKGLKLTKEEFNALVTGLNQENRFESLSKLVLAATSWR
jgi:hypothetical protein